MDERCERDARILVLHLIPTALQSLLGGDLMSHPSWTISWDVLSTSISPSTRDSSGDGGSARRDRSFSDLRSQRESILVNAREESPTTRTTTRSSCICLFLAQHGETSDDPSHTQCLTDCALSSSLHLDGAVEWSGAPCISCARTRDGTDMRMTRETRRPTRKMQCSSLQRDTVEVCSLWLN